MAGVCDQGANLIIRVASKIVLQLLDPDTGAPLHEECSIVVRQEGKCALLSFASEVSLMECGHPGNFFLYVGDTEFFVGGQSGVENAREHSAYRHCAGLPLICHGGREMSKWVGFRFSFQLPGREVRIQIRVASKFCFRFCTLDTSASLRETERHCSSEGARLHLELYQQDVDVAVVLVCEVAGNNSCAHEEVW